MRRLHVGPVASTICFSLLLSASSFGQPCEPADCGSWMGWWNLGIADTTTCLQTFGKTDEIAHAVLLPRGNHEGKIMVWQQCDDHTESYIWDPEMPDGDVIPVPFVVGSDPVFCAGMVWLKNGNLLTVGTQQPTAQCATGLILARARTGSGKT